MVLEGLERLRQKHWSLMQFERGTTQKKATHLRGPNLELCHMSDSLILLAHCCSLAAGLFVVSQKCLLHDEGFKLL